MGSVFDISDLGQFNTQLPFFFPLQGQSLSRIWRSVIQAPFLTGKKGHTLKFATSQRNFYYLNAFNCLSV